MEPVVEEQQEEDPRDPVLPAALKLFAEKGFFNTSLTEIADAAGLKNTSALHHLFKTKQAIASALYASILDSLSISIDDIKRNNQKPSEQLRAIVDLLFNLAEEAPDVIRLLLNIGVNEILPGEKPIIESAPFLKIHKIFVLGVKSGEIRNLDPMLLHAYFFGIINNTLLFILTGVLQKQSESYHSQAWLAAWNSIAKNKTPDSL